MGAIDLPCAKGEFIPCRHCPYFAKRRLLTMSHFEQVRCDAASLGVPCTNCVAFSIECKIPTPKRKKNQTKSKDTNSGYVNYLIACNSSRQPLTSVVV
jgi:hypothetical protein